MFRVTLASIIFITTLFAFTWQWCRALSCNIPTHVISCYDSYYLLFDPYYGSLWPMLYSLQHIFFYVAMMPSVVMLLAMRSTLVASPWWDDLMAWTPAMSALRRGVPPDDSSCWRCCWAATNSKSTENIDIIKFTINLVVKYRSEQSVLRYGSSMDAHRTPLLFLTLLPTVATS